MALKKPDTNQKTQNQIMSSGLPLKRESKDKEQLVQKNIRLTDNDWNILENIFEKKGLSISSGLRMIVRQYIEDNK